MHALSLSAITIDDVKDALGITDGSHNDMLERVIDGVTGAIEDYLGRPVIARSVTESVDGNGTDSILLKPYLVSVTTVTIDDVTVAAANRVFYPKTGEVRLLNTIFTSGSQNVDLVYRHGWEAEDVPAQIRTACVNWCVHQWMMTEKDRIGVSAKSTPEFSISYEPDAVPRLVTAMLDRWRIASFG